MQSYCKWTLHVFWFSIFLLLSLADSASTSAADLPDEDRQPIGFTGYVKDTESGLYYARARYYDPFMGRFITQDPAEGNPMQPPSLHRYLYAYANPTVYTDSSGRQVDIEDPARAAIVLGMDDGEFAEALRVQAAAREVASGAMYGALKQAAQGLASIGAYGARLAGKVFFDIGTAEDVIDPLVSVAGATADAIRSGPEALVEHEAHKSVQSYSLIRSGRNFEAGELYGPESATALGAGLGWSRSLGRNRAGDTTRAEASVVVESAGGESMLASTTAASSNGSAFVGPTIGKSGFGSWDEFNVEAYRRYQRYVDDAYDAALIAEQEGLLRGNRNTRLGSFVDQTSRARMIAWLRAEGIPEGPGNSVQLNRWLRNPSGTGAYVRPDVQVPGLILDATVGRKHPETSQLMRNAEYSGGIPTTVVRPSQLGGSCSVLPCPGS